MWTSYELWVLSFVRWSHHLIGVNLSTVLSMAALSWLKLTMKLGYGGESVEIGSDYLLFAAAVIPYGTRYLIAVGLLAQMEVGKKKNTATKYDLFFVFWISDDGGYQDETSKRADQMLLNATAQSVWKVKHSPWCNTSVSSLSSFGYLWIICKMHSLHFLPDYWSGSWTKRLLKILSNWSILHSSTSSHVTSHKLKYTSFYFQSIVSCYNTYSLAISSHSS